MSVVLEYHDIARDVSRSKASKKIVAVCTDLEGVLGLGKGHVMAPRATIVELLEDSELDRDLRDRFEDVLEAIDETVKYEAQDSLIPIKSADDF